MEKFAQLLPELKENILTHHVDTFINSVADEDPAHVWTQLRKLSPYQRRRLEVHFREVWVPKLIVTLYIGPRKQVDYKLSVNRTSGNKITAGGAASDKNADVVCFETQLRNGTWLNQDILKRSWDSYSEDNPSAHLRLGEGVMNQGLRGGYLINDIKPSGLRWDDNGLKIFFDWKKTFAELFGEETMLRQLRKRLYRERSRLWREKHNLPESKEISHDRWLKWHINEIQMQSRVMVLQRRIERQNTGRDNIRPVFNQVSKHHHKQEPTNMINPDELRGCFCCTRSSTPDLFEVLYGEESMVAVLAKEDGITDTKRLIDLYAEEFGWQCCITTNSYSKSHQQQRKADWLQYCNTEDAIWKRCHESDRWDILG